LSTDASTQQLTDAQVLAAARTGGVFIEAHPGSGKTTVAARRFGVLRFGAARIHDARPVVAVSFTGLPASMWSR
jgi:DNA helicase II / ATP-dependent DNA helicase PcrA